ncbi:MAG: hypothetical protein D8M57_05680 [Candidatus Scalindua sp. AMX11]|nr:MAG: hypothetical protein DWQ00_02045 [Candidatus Scalindua sp.]TDE65797.1 MAG: hypothetical protein D8M57_05680 [Candidatus Scalindua sp. AMX11]
MFHYYKQNGIILALQKFGKNNNFYLEKFTKNNMISNFVSFVCILFFAKKERVLDYDDYC